MSFFLGFAQGMENALERKLEREKFYTVLAERRRAAATARAWAEGRTNKQQEENARRAAARLQMRLTSGSDPLSDEEASFVAQSMLSDEAAMASLLSADFTDSEGKELYGRDLREALSVAVTDPETGEMVGTLTDIWGAFKEGTGEGVPAGALIAYDFSRPSPPSMEALETRVDDLAVDLAVDALANTDVESLKINPQDSAVLETLKMKIQDGEADKEDIVNTLDIISDDRWSLEGWKRNARVDLYSSSEEARQIMEGNLDVYSGVIKFAEGLEIAQKTREALERVGGETPGPNIQVSDGNVMGPAVDASKPVFLQSDPRLQSSINLAEKAEPFWSGMEGVGRTINNRLLAVPVAAGNVLTGAATDLAGAGASILGYPEAGAALEGVSDRAYNRAVTSIMEGGRSALGIPRSELDINPSDYQRRRGY